MRDLFDGVPNLANKRQPLPMLPPSPPVVAIPDESLLPTLYAQRERLMERIKPRSAGVTELRCELKRLTHLILRLELIQ